MKISKETEENVQIDGDRRRGWAVTFVTEFQFLSPVFVIFIFCWICFPFWSYYQFVLLVRSTRLLFLVHFPVLLSIVSIIFIFFFLSAHMPTPCCLELPCSCLSFFYCLLSSTCLHLACLSVFDNVRHLHSHARLLRSSTWHTSYINFLIF